MNFFSRFTSGKPELRVPLGMPVPVEEKNRNRASTSASITRLRPASPLTDKVKRGIPRFIRGGPLPAKINKQRPHPLEAIVKNPIFDKLPLSKLGETIKPISWAPLTASIHQIPWGLSSV